MAARKTKQKSTHTVDGPNSYYVRGNAGRPTLYNVRFIKIAEGMAQMGATSVEIAYRFGVTVKTLWEWSNSHEEFAKALNPGLEGSVRRARRGLLERAIGYTYPSEVIKVIDKRVVRVPIMEHVPPDVNAALTWLQKHCPEEWGQIGKTQVEHSGTVAVSMADLICEVHRQRDLERASKAILIEGTKEEEHG
jgi:hypothetical protein